MSPVGWSSARGRAAARGRPAAGRTSADAARAMRLVSSRRSRRAMSTSVANLHAGCRCGLTHVNERARIRSRRAEREGARDGARGAAPAARLSAWRCAVGAGAVRWIVSNRRAGCPIDRSGSLPAGNPTSTTIRGTHSPRPSRSMADPRQRRAKSVRGASPSTRAMRASLSASFASTRSTRRRIFVEPRRLDG